MSDFRTGKSLLTLWAKMFMKSASHASSVSAGLLGLFCSLAWDDKPAQRQQFYSGFLALFSLDQRLVSKPFVRGSGGETVEPVQKVGSCRLFVREHLEQLKGADRDVIVHV
jgi:hypothetical protein